MNIVRINAMWCSGCLVMKKVWKQIEEEYPDVEFQTLDYDMDEEEVANYNPGTILPVSIFYKDGKEVKRLNGEHTKDEIVTVIEEYK